MNDENYEKRFIGYACEEIREAIETLNGALEDIEKLGYIMGAQNQIARASERLVRSAGHIGMAQISRMGNIF